MSQILLQYQNLKSRKLYPSLLYVLQIFLFYLGWKITMYLMRNQLFWSDFKNLIASITAKTCAFFIETFFGITCFTEGRILRLDGTSGLFLGDSCLGITSAMVFVSLVLFYPGNSKHKFWYIPLGILIVWFGNLFRITGLALMQKYTDEAFVLFNHSYTYLIISYSLVLMLAAIWMKKIEARF